jgi:hypothetical protein
MELRRAQQRIEIQLSIQRTRHLSVLLQRPWRLLHNDWQRPCRSRVAQPDTVAEPFAFALAESFLFTEPFAHSIGFTESLSYTRAACRSWNG